MPRQNHRDHEGDRRGYGIQVSDDDTAWHEIKRGELVSTFAPQRINFSQIVTARCLTLTAQSGFGNDVTAALVEPAIIYASPKLIDADAGAMQYQRSKSASPDIDEGTTEPDRPAKKGRPVKQ